jgi:glycosyltransferase involved in cell wall biosynthesis
MRSLTIVVPTHQRRRAVTRLVRDLGAQLGSDERSSDDVDVVVVVDGSTDGTVEELESLDYPVPLKVVWQRNRGRSAARNVGLNLARGEIVLFLDDDLVPLPGLVDRHRASHESADDHVLVGPYPLMPRPFPVAPNNEWFDQVYAELAEARVIDRADRFSIGNTSGPVATFRTVGGFEEGFTGWGCEDIELGHRLLQMGVDVQFDGEAAAEHRQELSVAQLCANSVSNGRNIVRAVTLHPELVDEILPAQPTLQSRRPAKAFARAMFRMLPVHSPLPYRLLAAAAAPIARAEGLLTGNRSQSALYVAMAASTLAGIAEADPSGALVERKLGVNSER